MNKAVTSRGENPVALDNLAVVSKAKCSGVDSRLGVVDGTRGEGWLLPVALSSRAAVRVTVGESSWRPTEASRGDTGMRGDRGVAADAKSDDHELTEPSRWDPAGGFPLGDVGGKCVNAGDS